MVSNPFITYGYESADYFCDRKRETQEVAVSREGKARQITGAPFVKRHNLSSASSVQKSAQALMERQLLTHNQGVYEVYDKFMALWLRES